MSTYYVREQGAVVRKQEQRLLVTRERNAVMAEIPLHQLDQLVVMGNVQLTTQALALLLQSEVDVVFMSVHGKVRGRVVANESKFAELRLKQLQAMSDELQNLALAKAIVVGKLANQLGHLRKAADGVAGFVPRDKGTLDKALRGIAEMMVSAQAAGNADSLRGFEGKAGAWYWSGFRTLLKHDLDFKQRIYHPSPDPVNALLSFSYALLQKDVNAATHLVGLDPYLGFFHTVQYGRPSLVLDLMEEFRPLLVDPLVVELLNRERIGKQDFVKGPDKDRPLVMTDATVKRVIEAYEQRVTKTTTYPFTGEQTMWRRCLELQTRQMARVIKGEAKGYRAMTNPLNNTAGTL
jgi:CRISPR-associated protein Cas1